MFDDLRFMAKANFVELFDHLEKFKQEHPNLAILGWREAIKRIRSEEPDPRITEVKLRTILVRNQNGRGHYFALAVSVPGYSFRLKLVPADPAICLLNTVFLTSQADRELLASERRAQRKLRDHISREQWVSYQLTSSFTEMSPKSSLLYLFRRGFPTLVFRSSPEGNSFLVGLCLHTGGYGRFTWAGYLCPTDDVIASLLLMRSQEQKFWAKAGHHQLHSPMLGV